MGGTHDQPLPGDLVIRKVSSDGVGQPAALYVVSVYPQLQQPSTAADNLAAIVERARLLAQKRGGTLQVWREETAGPVRYARLDTRSQ